MLAVSTLFTVILVAICGQLARSSPVFGEIVQPVPNTYTIGEGKETKVEVRRVPVHKNAQLYAEGTLTNASVSFGELTPRSNLAI